MAIGNGTCSIDGCTSPHAARGWCAKHYKRWKAHGDPTYTRPKAPTLCRVDGCGGPAFASALCNAHYKRWRKYGDPESGGPRHYSDPDESFDARTEKDGGCLVWIGATTGRGYGYLNVDGRMEYAHRFAWLRVHGKIPSGTVINHRCWNIRCVLIDHLETATVEQNAWYRSGPSAMSSSGIRGVNREAGKWVVKFKKRGEVYRFGVYSDVKDAAEVAERARREVFGSHAGRG